MGLTKSQSIAFRSIKGGANLFLTGKAGTGKSYVIDRVKEWCTLNGYTYLVCAPTGIAALNVGGSTIHKVFSPGSVGILEPDKIAVDPRVRKRLEKVDVVIIDEISMCRADLFKFVAKVLFKAWKKKPEGKRKQLIVVGDFYQLAPVIGSNEKLAYQTLYGDMEYAFQTPEWQRLGLESLELQESMRQDEPELIKTLDKIREGKATLEDFAVFETSEPDPKAITICGKNDQAEEINRRNLEALIAAKRKKRTYKCESSGHTTETDFNRVDMELKLAVGARVIMMNNDPDKRWVNGSFGNVTGLTDSTVTVKIDNGETVDVERYKWEFEEYSVAVDKDGKKTLEKSVRATITQFPMRLGWAVSIHKSQGQTFSAVNVDLRSIFCKGQMYVALSRCKTLAGMHIIGKLDPEKVMVDDVVKRFMEAVHSRKLDLTDQMIPFGNTEDDEEETTSSTNGISDYDHGYNVGYEEGYDDGKEFTRQEYLKMVSADPAVKMVSPRVAREREKEGMAPEERNPHGAGRKPKPQEELKPSKAIRVPASVADVLKQLGDLAKERPDEVVERCRSIIEAMA